MHIPPGGCRTFVVFTTNENGNFHNDGETSGSTTNHNTGWEALTKLHGHSSDEEVGDGAVPATGGVLTNNSFEQYSG